MRGTRREGRAGRAVQQRSALRASRSTLLFAAVVFVGCARPNYLVVQVGLQNSFVNPTTQAIETFGQALHSLSVTTTDQNGGSVGPITVPEKSTTATLGAQATTLGSKTIVSFLIEAPKGSLVSVAVNGLDATGTVLGSGFGESAALSGSQTIEIDLSKHCTTVADCNENPFCLDEVTCTNGVCIEPTTCPFTCTTGQVICGGADGGYDAGPLICVNVSVDSNNCGACDQVCVQGQSCIGGVCTCPDQAPSLCTSKDAGSFCLDEQTDPQNCGGCGLPCLSAQLCQDGVCGCPTESPLLCQGEQGSACTDPLGDPLNCGGCGHSCLGGACGQGSCAPLELASGLTGAPSALTLDGENLYWLSNASAGYFPDSGPYQRPVPENHPGSVMMMAIDGGVPTVLVASENNVTALVADAGVVYWISNLQTASADAGILFAGFFKSASVENREPRILYEDTARPVLLAIDSENAYWAEINGTCANSSCSANYSWQAFRFPLAASSSPTPFNFNIYGGVTEGGDPPVALAVSPNYAYLFYDIGEQLNDTTLARFELANLTAENFWTIPGPNSFFGGSGLPLSLTVTDELAFASTLAIGSGDFPGSGPAVPTVFGLPSPLDGGTLAAIQAEMGSSLALDGVDLYGSNADAGTIWRLNLDAGASQIVATGQQNPEWLVLDSVSAYWLNAVDGGSVMRLAR